ncbi:MAG: hypothetical protein ABIP63_05375 [Thermoanaerobaculia bacterium]
MNKVAIILAEGRGEAIHLREDASLNLLQAALLGRDLIEGGWRVQIRVIIDPGQSIEEYSLLCHAEDEEIVAYRQRVTDAQDGHAARHALVREIRERNLAFAITADAAGETRIEDGLFFAAFLARITDLNPAVLAAVRTIDHPLVDRAGIEAYEELLHDHLGRPYLDLEEAVARWTIRRCLGSLASEVPVSAVARLHGPPETWLSDPLPAGIIASDLASKERGEGDDFRSRLIGLFTTVQDASESLPYFNSPTSCRREHGKVRIIPRDRFDLLGLKHSERMSFDRFRELIAQQNAGAPGRPLALKYPYAARLLSQSIVRDARSLAADGAAQVIFVEGIEGSTNGGTGELIDLELRETLPALGVPYRRVIAARGTRQLLPNSPGGLPLIVDRLWPRIDTTFAADFDRSSVVRMTPDSVGV